MNLKRRPQALRPKGFTLIEAVVCIAVIGILAALALSGLQAARGASKRLGCLHNLHQIGLALNSYRTVIGGFPSAKNGKAFSIHSMLLPYLDQTNLYNSINFETFPKPITRWGRQNYTVYSASVEVFICPADRDHRPTGATSYAGNRGTGVQRYGYNGAFSDMTNADFKDGTSTTIAFSEWVIGRKGLPRRDEPNRLVFATGLALTKPDELDEFAKLCSSADPAHGRLSPLLKGESWLLGELSYTLYNHVININGYSCTNQELVQEGAWTAGSLHGQGANVLFADGHAKFLYDTLVLEAWRALGSRDGGEAIPSQLPDFVVRITLGFLIKAKRVRDMASRRLISRLMIMATIAAAFLAMQVTAGAVGIRIKNPDSGALAKGVVQNFSGDMISAGVQASFRHWR